MADDTPKLLTPEEAAALDRDLLDKHPHLGRPSLKPVYKAIVKDYYDDLVREKGGHEAAHQDLRASRYRHFDEIEQRVRRTISTAANLDKRDAGDGGFVRDIERSQYERGLYGRPAWMSNEEAREIDQEHRARSRMGVMRVAG